MVVLDECPEGGQERPEGDMCCSSVADALGEWQQAEGERPEQAGDLNELRNAASSLERRVAAMEARSYVDAQTLDQLVSKVHAGLEAQCAALYREQSEALAKQMAELLVEVQSLHWKAFDGTGTVEVSTQRSESSTMLGEDSARLTQEEGTEKGSSRTLPIATFAELAGSPTRLSAWNVLDPKELALRRLDERVSTLELRLGQLALSTPTTWRGAEVLERPMVPEPVGRGPPSGASPDPAATAATGTGLESVTSEPQGGLASNLSSSMSSLAAAQSEQLAQRLAHSASSSGLRRTLAAPPPKTEPADAQAAGPTAQTLSPQLRPCQSRRAGCCASPVTLMSRGRGVATPGALTVGAGAQEIRGRLAGSTLQLGTSPAPARSVSPPWHDISLNSSAHRSGTIIGASMRGASASPAKTSVVMPTTPQQFARRQSSSPSPMTFASTGTRPGTTCIRSVPNLRI